MKRQRGFALLLVFVMAAAVAITLYRELPRVAFEAQRNKEQRLIDHGEQYMRAIQLYVRKAKAYPISIEQLEGTSGQIRYLRKRYNDPMTGKSEWRLVHIGPAGQYTDSLVHKPPTAKQDDKSASTSTEGSTMGGNAGPGTGVTDPAFPQLRPSERAGLPMPGQQQAANPADPQAPPPPQMNLPILPAIPSGVVVPPSATTPQQGVNPFQPGQTQTGLPGSQTGVNPGQPPPPGQPGAVDPSAPPGQNQALDLINSMLRQPRQIAQTGGQAQGMQIGSGSIAGVASTVERTGIKIYREMGKYNEWEFLYDPTQDKSGLLGMMQGQQQGQRTGQTPLQPQQPQQASVQPIPPR